MAMHCVGPRAETDDQERSRARLHRATVLFGLPTLTLLLPRFARLDADDSPRCLANSIRLHTNEGLKTRGTGRRTPYVNDFFNYRETIPRLRLD